MVAASDPHPNPVEAESQGSSVILHSLGVALGFMVFFSFFVSPDVGGDANQQPEERCARFHMLLVSEGLEGCQSR